MALFHRREASPYFSNYQRYKPFLRRDFLARCSYCERTEHYLGGEEAFEVEHFKPRARFPDLICAYGNLYYACRKCNAHKSETWPSGDQLARGMRFADPCAEDLCALHLRERETGALDALTPCGAYSSRHIRLDREELRRWRRLRSEARQDLQWLRRTEEFIEKSMSITDTNSPQCEEMANCLSAIRRRIEESKLRFSIE